MIFHVITLFPDELARMINFSVTGRALETGLAELETCSPRDFSGDERGTVDGRPFGGGPGMVMAVDPLEKALGSIDAPAGTPVVYLSPQGKRLDQSTIKRWSQLDELVLLCGRYEGIDQRFIDRHVDEECSIGDYVISGGELAAAVVMDAVIRQLPGALGKDASAVEDSFMDGVLDCPHFTRPVESGSVSVPPVLRSGDHGAIDRWRLERAMLATWLNRPDLLSDSALSGKQKVALANAIAGYMTAQ